MVNTASAAAGQWNNGVFEPLMIRKAAQNFLDCSTAVITDRSSGSGVARSSSDDSSS
jgi:hypothetical protein